MSLKSLSKGNYAFLSQTNLPHHKAGWNTQVLLTFESTAQEVNNSRRAFEVTIGINRVRVPQ